MAFNPSGRKEDLSLKLKARNMHNTREQTRSLEEENRQMEQRLLELKLAMTREKEERENKGGGFWKRGQSGNLGNYAKEVISKPPDKPKSQKTRKIKVLHDEPIVTPQRNKLSNVLKTNNNNVKIKGPRCGQCEQRAAQVSCVECGEEYCAGCFAGFHMKGALKKHRSMPVGSAHTPRNVLTPRQTPQPAAPPVDRSPPKLEYKAPETKVVTVSQIQNGASEKHGFSGASLLDGEYDESESASSFQDALKAWRTGGNDGDKKDTTTPPRQVKQPVRESPRYDPVSSMEHGTSTQGGDLSKPDLEIHFNQHSVSYAEKLLLKKHRRTDVGGLDANTMSETSSNGYHVMTPDYLYDASSGSYNVTDNGPFVSEDRVDFASLFEAVKPRQNELDRGESRISIVEVDSSTVNSADIEETSSYEVQEEPDPKIASPSKAIKSKNKRMKSGSSGVKRNQEASQNRGTTPRTSKTNQSRPVASSVEMTEVTDFNRPHSRHNSAALSRPGSKTSNKAATMAERTKSTDLLPTRNSHTPQLVSESDSASSKMTLKMQSKESIKKADKWATPRKGGRTESRAKSRNDGVKTARERPASRAKSRAASRLSMFGEGVLTKTPSAQLQDIARMTPELPPSGYSTVLSDFFMAGVTPVQQDRIIVPSADKNKNNSQQKWKVSNKLYQMAPRSWRPEKSLGESLPVEDVKIETDLTVEEFFSRPATAQNGSISNQEPDIQTLCFSLSNLHEEQLRKEASLLEKKSKDLQSSQSVPVLSKSRKTEMQRKSNQSASVTHSNKVSISRPATASGRESRAIVVDGDDMSRYDDNNGSLDDEHDDAEALHQLEWELASQTGMIDADGKISRMSMLTPDIDDSNFTHDSPGEQEVDEGIDIDGQLREDELRDNFEENENCAMEQEVSALN